ncbi:MAG TPA: hypothetical protein VH878_09845, partial [Thermodesulfobacteriota bacterium]
MTIEITEYKCPTCGHILDEEEHRHALSKHEKDRQAMSEDLRTKLANKFEEKLQQEREKYQRENQQLREEIENKANLKAQSKIDDILLKEQEKRRLAVNEALSFRDEKWRLEEKQYQKLIEELQKDKRKLENTLDSIPPERRGTAGERILTEDLRKAFPRDDLEEK